MDVYLVLVRLIHIVAAIVWVGTGFFMVRILFPSLAQLGTDAGKAMTALAKNPLFTLLFPVSAGVTVLAGILLYLKPGESSHFSSAGWAVLSIGALAGLAAAGHGGAVLNRITDQYTAALNSGTAQAGEIAAIGEKLQRHGNISLALMFIAVLGMALARYL